MWSFCLLEAGTGAAWGAGLAEYSLRTALAEAVLGWEFEPAAIDYEIRHDLAMGPRYGVTLRIQARRTTEAQFTGADARVVNMA